ncbi:MAG: WD40/YVTN/BNR-like repeat-containing protein, partial [Chloroflexota bacterium]
DGLTSPYIQALVASPHFPKDRTLFAGTLGSGVMRSTNGGETWGPVEFWQGAQAVTALAVSPEFPEEGTLLAGTQSDGVYRSTNGGRTWSQANFGINDLSILALALSPGFADDETAFCLAGDGLYRSTNGARAWRSVTRGLESDAVQAVDVSPAFIEDGTVFVGTEDQGVFRSTDRGASWQAANDGLTNLSVNALWVSPRFESDRTVYAGTAGSGVFRSSDGGRSWEHVAADELDELAVMALVSDASGKTLVAGLHQSGLFRSADAGTTWEPANEGLAARSMSTLLVSPVFHEDRTLFAAGVDDGILRSRDGGETWEHANDGLPGPQILSLAISPRYGEDKTLLAALGEGLFRSADGGATWEGIGPEGLQDPRMIVYSRDASGSQLFVGLAAGQKAYLSENGGGIWRDLSGPFADEELVGIALSPNFASDHTLLLATFSATGALRRNRERAPGARQPFREDAPQSAVTVWRSVDGGRRWSPVIEQLTGARWVTFAFPHDYRGDQESNRNGFVVGIGTLIQRPMWGGKQLWMAERVGRPNTAILSLAISQGSIWGRSVYVGASDGVFRSDDEGLTWHPVQEGLHSRTVVAVALSPTYHEGGDAFALTLGGVVHRLARD